MLMKITIRIKQLLLVFRLIILLIPITILLALALLLFTTLILCLGIFLKIHNFIYEIWDLHIFFINNAFSIQLLIF